MGIEMWPVETNHNFPLPPVAWIPFSLIFFSRHELSTAPWRVDANGTRLSDQLTVCLFVIRSVFAICHQFLSLSLSRSLTHTPSISLCHFLADLAVALPLISVAREKATEMQN